MTGAERAVQLELVGMVKKSVADGEQDILHANPNTMRNLVRSDRQIGAAVHSAQGIL